MIKFKIGDLVTRNKDLCLSLSENYIYGLGNITYKIEYITKTGLLLLENYSELIPPCYVILNNKPVTGYVVYNKLFLNEQVAWDYYLKIDEGIEEGKGPLKIEIDLDSFLQYISDKKLMNLI